jgi:hypothetical protein
MRVSRRSVFETNSSSTHSITIVPGTCAPGSITVENGVCKIHTGEFGWEECSYYDAPTKAAYCLTDAKQTENAEHLEMLRAVVGEATGAETVEFVPSTCCDYHKWGYIDHQSDGVCGPAWESPEALRNFIFNPQSELQTDNDNH